MYCKTCGQSNPDWSNYCLHDGTALVNSSSSNNLKLNNKETNFCQECGGKINGTDNYCNSCGYSLLKFTMVEEETKIPLPVKKTLDSSRTSFSLSPDFFVNALKKALVPAVIAFALMLVLNYVLSTFVTSSYNELFEEAFGSTPEEIAQEFADELDTNVKAPGEITGFTDYVMAAHLMTPRFEMEVISNIFGEDIKATGELDVTVKNVLYLLLPIIALFVGGIFYRKKDPQVSIQSFLSGAIGIGLIYGLLLSIVSLFSGFDYKLNLSDAGESVSFKFNTSYSFFITLIKGFLIGTIFSLLGMLFSINYRKVTKQLDTLIPFGNAVHQGFSAFVRGFVTLSIIMIFVLGTKIKDLKESLEWIGNPILDQLFEKTSMAVAFVGVELSSLIYSMLHFSPLSFELTEGGVTGETGGIDFSIFSGITYHGAAQGEELPELDYFISAYDIDLYLKLAILIPIIFLLFAGYRMAVSNQANFKSLAIVSLVYSLFTAILASICSITIEGEMKAFGEGTEGISILLVVSVFKVFMGSFILSYIASFAGSYVSKFLPKR